MDGAVAFGGALGSMARHGINHLVHVRSMTTRFPAGTVVVNVLGCLVIGLLARTHSAGQAGVNVAVQVIGGLVVVWLGYLTGAARSV